MKLSLIDPDGNSFPWKGYKGYRIPDKITIKIAFLILILIFYVIQILLIN